MIDEDEGRKVHVDTVEGKYDLHYEKSGRFAPKEGGETYDADTDEYKSEDVFDAKSLFGDMKLDEDLESFDIDSLSDIELDDDLEGLDDLQGIDIEERINNSVTLKNYRETRAKRISKMRPSWSPELAMKFRDKMHEIMEHTTVISRIPEGKFLNLIISGEYMNQFGAGSSEGAYTATGTDGGGRGRMTKACFGTEISGTTREDRKKWEKYGTFCPDGDYDSIIDRKDSAGCYGDIVCIYKKDKVKGLVTFTGTDSLSYDDQCPVLIEDDMDEFCMHTYNRSFVTKDNIDKCKTINDVKKIINSYSYCEAQIHVDKLTLDYFDAIAIPYSQLNGYNEENIKKAIKLAQEKYPDLKITSRDRSGKPRIVKVNDEDEYVYGDIYEMEKS